MEALATSYGQPPLFLRIPLGIVLILRVGQMMNVARNPLIARSPVMVSLNYILLGLAIAALIGIWRMNRWAVLTFAVLTAIHVVSIALLSGTTWRAPVSALVLGSVVLIPSAVCWKRMVWRTKRAGI